jgi:hypothetical protein
MPGSWPTIRVERWFGLEAMQATFYYLRRVTCVPKGDSATQGFGTRQIQPVIAGFRDVEVGCTL